MNNDRKQIGFRNDRLKRMMWQVVFMWLLGVMFARADFAGHSSPSVGLAVLHGNPAFNESNGINDFGGFGNLRYEKGEKSCPKTAGRFFGF